MTWTTIFRSDGPRRVRQRGTRSRCLRRQYGPHPGTGSGKRRPCRPLAPCVARACGGSGGRLEDGLARGVAKRGDRADRRHDFGAGREPNQLGIRHATEHALGIGETATGGLRGSLHALVAHPVVEFGLGHHHTGIREGQAAVFSAQTADVIAMEMADQHRVDITGLQTDAAEQFDDTPGTRRAVVGKTRVHEDAAALVQHQIDVVRHVDVVGGQAAGRQRRLDGVKRCIAHKFFGQWPTQHAVVQADDLARTDFETSVTGIGQWRRAKVGGNRLRPHGARSHQGGCRKACPHQGTSRNHGLVL